MGDKILERFLPWAMAVMLFGLGLVTGITMERSNGSRSYFEAMAEQLKKPPQLIVGPPVYTPAPLDEPEELPTPAIKEPEELPTPSPTPTPSSSSRLKNSGCRCKDCNCKLPCKCEMKK